MLNIQIPMNKTHSIQQSVLTIFIGALFAVAGFAKYAHADKVRVFYRPDGGVSITTFVTSYCLTAESELECKDRLTKLLPYKDYPYDDIDRDELPKEVGSRDKWTGAKGRGVWVDKSLITKREKITEYQTQLDQELDEDEPNSSKVLKLQRLIERVQDMPNPVLSGEELASLESRRDSLLAAALRSVGKFLSDIAEALRDSVLALKSLVTESLSVGSSQAPAGITIYDTKTGEPYCVVVESGVMKNLPGQCGAAAVDASASASSASGAISTDSTVTEEAAIPAESAQADTGGDATASTNESAVESTTAGSETVIPVESVPSADSAPAPVSGINSEPASDAAATAADTAAVSAGTSTATSDAGVTDSTTSGTVSPESATAGQSPSADASISVSESASASEPAVSEPISTDSATSVSEPAATSEPSQ